MSKTLSSIIRDLNEYRANESIKCNYTDTVWAVIKMLEQYNPSDYVLEDEIISKFTDIVKGR